jgi:nucleotide-binding universal stress UspA family protein
MLHLVSREKDNRSMGDIERILVPLDGSKLFKTALPMAIALAKQYNAQIILLHALEQSQYLPTIAHGSAVLYVTEEAKRRDIRPNRDGYPGAGRIRTMDNR